MEQIFVLSVIVTIKFEIFHKNTIKYVKFNYILIKFIEMQLN